MSITALAGLPERTFVIRDQMLPASEANDANIPAWDLSINYVPVTYPNYTPAVIQTNPGQQELWRVANTAADTILNLQYVVNGTPQAMQVVAIDGYPIASGSSGQPSESETSILLPPGARAEFVVTTPQLGDQAQLTTQNWDTGPDGDFDPTRTIANIVSQSGVEGSSTSGAAPGGCRRTRCEPGSHASQRWRPLPRWRNATFISQKCCRIPPTQIARRTSSSPKRDNNPPCST